MRKLIALGLLVSSAVPLAAQTPPATTAATATKDAKAQDLEKIVCREMEQIGSRLGAKKVCLTVKQWQERAQGDRDQTERLQRQALAPPSG